MNEKRTDAEEYWKELHGEYPEEDDKNWYWFLRGWEDYINYQWEEV